LLITSSAIAFATAVDVLSAFVVTFSIPYILGSPGANLGAGVGWLLGGDSILCLIFAILFVPELKGRSLEEVDELFEANLWAWQFSSYQTTGVGSRIAQVEKHDTIVKQVSHVSESGSPADHTCGRNPLKLQDQVEVMAGKDVDDANTAP
jgi:hypothetical protein